MIHCIGAGPGNLDYLTQIAARLLAEAEVAAGFHTVLRLVEPLLPADCLKIGMDYKDQTDRLSEVAARHREGKRCVVVFMGDIHFSGFQYLERVERAVGCQVPIVPGISSAQMLASKARVCFDETTFLTLHRRGDIEPFLSHMVNALRDGRNVIVIPRPWDAMPGDISKFLIAERTAAEHPVEIWENLTGEESAWSGNLNEVTNQHSDMSIMLIRSLYPMKSQLEPDLQRIQQVKQA